MQQSLNKEFCVALEYQLSVNFKYSEDNRIRHFWCDGISMPLDDSQLSLSNITKKKLIKTKAWIGTDGQGEYEMTIHFGPLSLSQYARGDSLVECLPTDDWIEIDIKKR